MEEKERRMKRKRQQREYQQQIAAAMTAHHSQPFYVKSPSLNSLDAGSPADEKRPKVGGDMGGVDSKIHSEYSRFVAPLAVCLLFTFLYVLLGSFMLLRFDVSWSLVDSIYFSFMLITTVGVDDSMPVGSALSPNAQYVNHNNSVLVWFFSFYIFIGLGLSSMCYCTIHEGVKRKMNKLYTFSDNLRRSRCSGGSSDPNCSKENEFDLTKEMTVHGTTDISWQRATNGPKANGDVFNIGLCDSVYSGEEGYGANLVTSFIGDNGYPQPEIVAITTGVPTINIKRDVAALQNRNVPLNVLPEEDEENVEV